MLLGLSRLLLGWLHVVSSSVGASCFSHASRDGAYGPRFCPSSLPVWKHRGTSQLQSALTAGPVPVHLLLPDRRGGLEGAEMPWRTPSVYPRISGGPSLPRDSMKMLF